MNKRQLLFRIGAIAIVLAVAAIMFVIGRGHTVYFDNKTTEYNGQTYEAYNKVIVTVGGEETAKLSKGDRGVKEFLMGQTLKLTLEITETEGAAPQLYDIKLPIPYSLDGIIINIPALMAELPEEAYMSEFVIVPTQEEMEEEPQEGGDETMPGTDEFDMGGEA